MVSISDLDTWIENLKNCEKLEEDQVGFCVYVFIFVYVECVWVSVSACVCLCVGGMKIYVFVGM